jgi:hypothetical protein
MPSDGRRTQVEDRMQVRVEPSTLLDAAAFTHPYRVSPFASYAARIIRFREPGPAELHGLPCFRRPQPGLPHDRWRGTDGG